MSKEKKTDYSRFNATVERMARVKYVYIQTVIERLRYLYNLGEAMRAPMTEIYHVIHLEHDMSLPQLVGYIDLLLNDDDFGKNFGSSYDMEEERGWLRSYWQKYTGEAASKSE